MNGDLAALAVGTLLSVGALAFVLYPLFFEVPPRRNIARPFRTQAKDSAIQALREIEFDKAIGKLSGADYAELRREYVVRALREFRTADAAAATDSATPSFRKVASLADPIEERVRAYRAARRECRTCGLRPEPDALYCSSCGVLLDGN